jgi:hypothetical protein
MQFSSGPRADELDTSGGSRRPRQTAVAGQEHGVQGLGQGYVGRIVRGQVLAKSKDAIEKGLVRVPDEVEGPKVLQRGHGRGRLEMTLAHVPSQRLGDFDVEEMGRVQRDRGVGDTLCHRLTRCRIE